MPNDQNPGASRRALLRAGAAAGGAAALGAVSAAQAGAAAAASLPSARSAWRGDKLPYPDVADTSHATERLTRIVKGFFAAKSLHHAADMVSFFAPAPAPVLYIDAGLGLEWPSQASLLAIWSSPSFADGPPDALSYPLRIIGDDRSAVIEFVDTPPLLGSEFRFLSSLTFDRHGKIVRWIDYWDGRSSLVRLPIGTLGPYPTDFRDNQGTASFAIRNASQRLQTAFAAGDPAAAAQLFTPDAVFEDMALHTRVEGQLQIQRYLTRGLGALPYGPGASVANIVGSDQGGGYEWHAAASAAPLLRGNIGLLLDETGNISRFTVIYDSYQFSDAQYRALASLNAET